MAHQKANNQFRMIPTYDQNGCSIEEMFWNLLKRQLVFVEKSRLDRDTANEVKYKAQDK